MKVINFGSLCIDNVYSVPYFVRPGETLPCTAYKVHPGGKGLNQSLALARAGAPVWHAGRVGPDGRWLIEVMAKAGVSTRLTREVDRPSGHAVIQVSPSGENAIVIFGGANRAITPGDVNEVLAHAKPGDYLLLQNEISCMPEILKGAHRAGMIVVLNAAPITPELLTYPLDKVSLFIINEVEGEALTDSAEPSVMIDRLLARYPQCAVTVTLGEAGAIYGDRNLRHQQAATPVTAVDSTGAGETFTGYFLAELIAGKGVKQAMATACLAGAICVTRPGAASSIPKRTDLPSG